MKVGVLAFQGAVREHMNMLKRAGAEPVAVKREKELYEVDALILPGGESTVIGKFLRETELGRIIIERAKSGMPVWGTCAGMILLAKRIVNENYVHLGLMDIWVRRNAYGSQLDSFIVRRPVLAVSPKPLELVFIRAPYAEKASPGVEVLLELDGKIVAARQNNLLATAFHPEVTDDPSFHKFFLEMVSSDCE